MTLFYLALAAIVAVFTASPGRGARAVAALLAGSALALLAWSIWLAHDDGTFAARPGDWRPPLLDLMGVIAAGGVLLLPVTLWRRPPRPPAPLTWRSDQHRHGRTARLLHWSCAVLMLAAVPIGLFVAVLPPDRSDRAEFLAAHVVIGLALLLLLVVRLGWRRVGPTPATAPTALTAHRLLLGCIGFAGVSGLWLAAALPAAVPGWGQLPAMPAADSARLAHLLVAALFGLVFAAHLAGALWQRFGQRAPLRMIG